MDTTHDNPLAAQLLTEIEAHCAATGMSDSAFGVFALGDPNFVSDIRRGREPRWNTIKAVRDKIREAAE